MTCVVLSKGRVAFSIATLFVALMTSTGALARGSGGSPGSVVRPDVGAYGVTYGELAGAWWNWALAGPTAESPILDPDGRNCALRQFGRIWFLAGNFGGTSSRTCNVPAGKAVFFPIFNSLYWYPEDGSTVEEVRPKAVDALEGALSLGVTIDGIPVPDPFAYRAASPPGGYRFDAKPGSIVETDFGYPPGPRFPAVADGYWILLRPLPPGHHTIRIQATATGGFELDVTYELEVSGAGH